MRNLGSRRSTEEVRFGLLHRGSILGMRLFLFLSLTLIVPLFLSLTLIVPLFLSLTLIGRITSIPLSNEADVLLSSLL